MREIDQKLLDAAGQGNLSEVKKCLSRGADVLARNSHHTVLHSAICGNNEEVIKLVLNKIKETQSQYIDAKDTEGDTPLMWAAEYGHVNAAEVLLDHGADTEVRNNDGMTALHWAAKKSEEEVAKLLIDKGADVYAEHKDGKKPLDIARELWPNSRVTQLLYENDFSLNEVATYAGEVAIGTAEVAGTAALVVAAGVAGLAIDAAVAVGELAVGAVQAVANAPAPVYDEERRGRLEAAAAGAQPGSYAYYRRTEHVRRDYGYDDSHDGCSIQFRQEQQKAYLHLSQLVSNNFQNVLIQPVKQSLYSPSFEELGIKMDGKCTAITRGFSQGLFFNQRKLPSNNTSANLYECVARGNQISKKEALAFGKLFNDFEQQLDSRMSSLPTNLICAKGYKKLDDLSNYIAGIKGDFTIHLVTNNHVVAIYRTGDNYAYFDCNTAFVSGLKSVDQLMQVVEKGVESAEYKVGEKGFLVEHFDVDRANSQSTDKGYELTDLTQKKWRESLECFFTKRIMNQNAQGCNS